MTKIFHQNSSITQKFTIACHCFECLLEISNKLRTIKGLTCLLDDSEDMGGKSKEFGVQSADYEPENGYESVSQI